MDALPFFRKSIHSQEKSWLKMKRKGAITVKIKVAFNKKLIPKEQAMGLAKKRTRRLRIEPKVLKAELCYKKLYFIKIMAYAARTPFKPKKIGYVLYYDSVVGKGGLTENVPETNIMTVSEDIVFKSVYTFEDLQKKKADLIEKFVLKNYLLKRPDLEEIEIEEVYLPYWSCEFVPNDKQESILINAATGKYNI